MATLCYFEYVLGSCRLLSHGLTLWTGIRERTLSYHINVPHNTSCLCITSKKEERHSRIHLALTRVKHVCRLHVHGLNQSHNRKKIYWKNICIFTKDMQTFCPWHYSLNHLVWQLFTCVRSYKSSGDNLEYVEAVCWLYVNALQFYIRDLGIQIRRKV